MSSFQTPPPLPPFKPLRPKVGQPQAKVAQPQVQKLHVPLREASKAVPVKQARWIAASPRDNPETAVKATTWAIRGRIQHESQATYEAAKQVVRDRIRKIVGNTASDPDIEDIISRLTAALRSAEVTVNFKAQEFFANKNTSASYTQMFERHSTMTGTGRYSHRIDVAKATQSGGVEERARYEEEKFILPVTPRRADMFANCVTRFGRTGGLHQMQQGSDLFVPNNSHFVGATRPRYTALNYTGDRNGACANNGHTYGCSVLVWKHDVKRRATFCPADTFLPQVTRETFCTYETMEVMLAWIEDAVLQDLYDMVVRNLPASPRPGRFIECHIYDSLNFHGMLDHIRVSHTDLQDSDQPQSAIERNITEFCQRNGTHWVWATK